MERQGFVVKELHVRLEKRKETTLDSKEKRKFKLGPFQKTSKTELNADNYKGLGQQSIQYALLTCTELFQRIFRT